MDQTSSVKIETIDATPQLLIVNNHYHLGQTLGIHFSSQGLEPHLYLEDDANLSVTDESFHIHKNLPHITPHYLCIILAPNQALKKTTAKLEQLIKHYPLLKKIIIISVGKTESEISNISVNIHQIQSQNKISIKHLVIFQLIGEGIFPNLPGQLNFLLQTKPESIPPELQTETIYPLSLKQVAQFASKLLFSSSSHQHSHILCGQPISVINFLLQASGFSPSTSEIPQNPPQIILSSQIINSSNQTQESLHLRTEKISNSELEDTISWLKQLTPLTKDSQDVLKQPPVDPSSTHSSQATIKQTLVSSPPPHKPHNPAPKNNPKKTLSVFKPDNKSFSFLATQKTTSKPKPTLKPDKPLVSKAQPLSFKPTKPKKSKKRKAIFLIFSSVLVLLGLFITSTVINLFLLTSSLQQLQTNVKKFELTQLESTSQKIKTHSRILKTQLTFFSPIVKVIFPHQLQTAYSLLQLVDQSSDLSLQLSQTLDLSSDLILAITDRQQQNIPLLLTTQRTNLTRIYHTLSEIEADIQAQPELIKIQKFGIGESLTTLQQLISETKPTLNQGIQLLSNSDSLLGFDRKKTYLVLLQNSAELRPTGGFIGSFALITFESGKLIDISVQDVYEADGQLKGHVEPPQAIKKHLGEANWYLRDVNWDPFFPTTAKRAIWFLDKETKVKADGVIGLNLYIIKDLLAVVGQINLPDYDLTIDDQNIFEKIEYFVELNQFAGSSQKADILGSLSRLLIDQLINSDIKTTIQSAKVFFDSFNHNQAQIYFEDQKLQSFAQTLNWAGEITSTTCPTTINSNTCLSDHLGIVEANVGVNKANYFVTRKIDHSITIDSKLNVSHQLKLIIHNSSTTETWPGGTYKNYLRFYLPKQSKLSSLSVDSVSIPSSNLDTSIEHENQVIGLLSNTAPGKTSTIVINYSLTTKLPPTNPTAYSFNQFNQPGTSNDPYALNINFPPNHSILTSTPEIDHTTNQVNLTTQLDQNLTYTFELAK